jgi:hypothetical protein
LSQKWKHEGEEIQEWQSGKKERNRTRKRMVADEEKAGETEGSFETKR